MRKIATRDQWCIGWPIKSEGVPVDSGIMLRSMHCIGFVYQTTVVFHAEKSVSETNRNIQNMTIRGR